MSVTKIRINQTQIDFKDAVAAATTANIADLATGAPNLIDGVTPVVGSRILVKNQGTASENGIYKVDVVGTGANGEWSRVEDMYTGDIVEKGLVVFVSGGTVSGKRGYMLTSAGPHTVGTTAQTYELLSDSNTGVTHAQHVYNEVATGTIGGGNTVFTTAVAFTVGKLRVYLNGVRQILGDDYTVTDVDEITFTFAPKGSPGNPDIVTFDYLVG